VKYLRDNPNFTKKGLEDIFRLPISWLPGLVLDAEGRECVSYADAPQKDEAEEPVPMSIPASVVYRAAPFTKQAKTKRRKAVSSAAIYQSDSPPSSELKKDTL
jgi:hypothetical protein